MAFPSHISINGNNKLSSIQDSILNVTLKVGGKEHSYDIKSRNVLRCTVSCHGVFKDSNNLSIVQKLY